MGDELDFHAVFEHSPNPYMLLDRELRYVAANDAYCKTTSRSRDELIGLRLTDVFPHDPNDPNNESKRRLQASFERVLETGKSDVLPFIHYRILVRDADGERWEDRWWSATHTPIRDAKGEVQRILQHTVDVTALRSTSTESGVLARAERLQERTESLDRTNAWLHRMFAQAPVALAVLSGPEHVVALANARVCEMWGREPARVLGRPLFDAMPEIRNQGLEGLLGKVLETGRPLVGNELPIRIARGPNGALETAWFDFVYQPFDDGGSVLVVATEVTAAVVARKKSETAQAELEAIFESFPEALFVGDASGFKRTNAAARRILGYESHDEMHMAYAPLLAELDARAYETGEPLDPKETPFARALRGEPTRAHVTLAHRRTGERRTMFSSSAPIRIDGVTVAAVVTQIDVTEQKRTESRTLQLARVLDETRDFVGIVTLDGTPTFLNQAALELIGLPDFETARTKNVIDYFAPRHQDRVRDEVLPAAIADGFWEGELCFAHHVTGEEIPVLYSVFTLRDAGGETSALATITRDLRAQKAQDAERVRLLEAERDAREQAERANAAKDEFLAIVSHELRTPLTAILGWMQMMKNGMVPPEKRARAIETVERNARVQAQLVDDLLDVSRIISGKLTLDMVSTDMPSVVAAAAETVRPVAEAKGVQLDVAIEPGLTVSGDSHRLQQVVWNLLSNAVKFTPKGGRVVCMVDARGEDIEIVVQDTGRGIPREFLPHVFERFRQAEGGTQRALGGLGLGLSIVQHVVVAHGGSVKAESDGPGQGAVFRVRLPRVSGRRTMMRDEDRIGAERLALPQLDGVHVLVVDDEPDVRDLLRALLSRANAKVTTASNAEEGLALVVSEKPDLLLSDIAMPMMDGYALVRRLRALDDALLARTPAVALTAHARSEDRTQALLAGFQNHVTKPVEPQELLAVLAALAPQPKRL